MHFRFRLLPDSCLLSVAVVAVVFSPHGSYAQQGRPVDPLILQVNQLLSEDRADSARVLIKKALSHDSTQANWWLLLAEVEGQRHEKKARRAALERHLALQPRSIEGCLALATDLVEAGFPDSAKVHAIHAYGHSRLRSPEAAYILGRIHEMTGRPDSAAVFYQRAYNLIPKQGLF